ncbi:MAG: endolytic transglycosylase MltG [Bacteroidales bacterium]|nr:endolytic transglycosylase MltG [Bacteroidales bacterium]
MKKRKKNRKNIGTKRKMILAAATVSAVVACVAAFVGLVYWADNVGANFTRKYTLYVYPDMSAGEVLDSINAGAGTIMKGSLERCARKESLAERIKPGKYVIDKEFSSRYVVRMLCLGWQTPQNLTLSGTLRSKERIAQVISRQMMIDSVTVDSMLRSEEFLGQYGFTPENVFALFLPDTYQMYWTASVEDIFRRFRKEYDAFWTEVRMEKAGLQGLTPMEVSVLASIVNGETLKSFEYPDIAGVYLNRLHKGMKLQADPTVAYCFGYTLNRILKVHLKVDSPYNTYKYAGLPPAPINVPPKACIDAVLNPSQHNYMFFCASPEFNGTHRFASSYTEHQRNAREFQRELTRRHKERAAM